MLHGAPQDYYRLFVSPAPADFPLPPHGRIFLDPAAAFQLHAGYLDAVVTSTPGQATFEAASPALVGASLYWQFLDGGLRVSNRAHTLIGRN